MSRGVNEMIFSRLDDVEFEKFYNRMKNANFMQSVERKNLRKRMGYGTELLGVKQGDKIVAGALVVTKEKEVWVQIGPILDYGNTELLEFFLKNLKEWA